ncbi:MAG: ribose ABC transporter permease [Trueperaceae bacterium]|jgi:ribose transport system permease protein|nr:ABC transporter permease [Truepera sp.]HRN18221.1 ribose ABC transporter permease [Trueperaceae bacterium]HRQ10422.1 ribose ABC transporter permease [Trueperaceae bacterium]
MSLARVKWRDLLARFGLFLAFIVMVIVLSLISDRFLTTSNVLNVLRQISVNAIIAFGMTVVIIGAGIDLSVGSMLALVGVIAAMLVTTTNIPVVIVLLIALAVGGGLGLLNGLIVGYAGVAPFIVTLAGLTIFRGMTLVLTDGRPISGLPPLFSKLGYGTFLGIPMPVWIMLAVLLLSYVLLRHTPIGRAVYAVGGNPEAARLSGIPVRRILTFTYVYSGLTVAVAAMVLTGRLNSAQPTAGQSFELDAIAAVVVGGTSLFGGRGSVWGTLVGALIIGVINNGMNLLNVSGFYQQIVKGGVILAALLIDRVLSQRKG